MNKSPNFRKTERKIGNTIYVITARFNGDKKRNIAASLARIIRNDFSSGNDIPKISA